MNSSNDSRALVPLFSLRIPGRLPLWNAMLGLSHWQRMKFKKQEQEKFLSALQAAAADWQTRTGCARNIFSIAADTMVGSLTTQQNASALRRAKKKLEKTNKKKQSSKSFKR